MLTTSSYVNVSLTIWLFTAHFLANFSGWAQKSPSACNLEVCLRPLYLEVSVAGYKNLWLTFLILKYLKYVTLFSFVTEHCY